MSEPADAHDSGSVGETGAMRSAAGARLTAGTALPAPRLLIDWGGVMTTNLFASFHAFCEAEELDPPPLSGRFRSDPEARELLIGFEEGRSRRPFRAEARGLLGLDARRADRRPLCRHDATRRWWTPCARPAPPGLPPG